jgi:hypothetical protein
MLYNIMGSPYIPGTCFPECIGLYVQSPPVHCHWAVREGFLFWGMYPLL